MLVRSSLATQFVAVFILCYLSLAAETATVRGRLRNYAYNTKCLRPLGQNNGAELEVVDCSDANTDQIIEASGFKNLESAAGYVQFDLGGKCLSLNGFSSDNEVRVLIWDCVGQDNQRWSVVNGNTGGAFQLQLKSTGKCLTAESGGTFLDQYDCYGTSAAPHQWWTLDSFGSNTVPTPQPTGYKGILRNFAFNTKCLHAKGDGNGAELEIVDCSTSNTDQFIKMDTFQNIENEAAYVQFDVSGKCLSLNGFSTDNEVHILIWDCVDQDNQKWKVVNGNKEASFQLQLKSSGKCLTAEQNGIYLDQYDCYGTSSAPHQWWTLDKIGSNVVPTPQPTDVTNKGILRNYAFNTKCLHANGDGNGAELEIVDCSASNTDQLIKMDTFQNIENEAAYVQFDVSGKCLSLNGFSTDNEVHILIWDCVDQDNQKWKVVNGNKEAAFQLQLKSSGKCLTAEHNGVYLDQYDCYGTSAAPHQWWTIDKIQAVPTDSDPDVAPYLFYQLESFDKPDKCLRYKDGTASNYALELAPCDPDDPSQQMVAFTDFTDSLGFSGLRFKNTAKCLDVSDSSNSNGASVGQKECVNQASQKWRMENFDLGTFRIRSDLGEKCLTSENSGTYMDIYDCYSKSNAPHQYWKQRNPNAGGGSGGGQKIRVLQNYKWPDKCLHPVGTSNENGATLELIDCNSIKPEESMNSNEWLNYDTTAGYVKFNSKCLSMYGFGSDNGVKIVQWDCVDQDNQRWQIVNGNIDTSFQLKSERSSKCLTAEGDGTYMDQWDCLGPDGAPHQSWMIKTIGGGGGQHDESSDSSLEEENFFEPSGAIIEVVGSPGKCLSVNGTDSSQTILADCNQFDENQLFDHSDLLNYNAHPGLLKNLGSNKCLIAASDGNVVPAECDITKVDELWFVVLGTLFGTFKLKASESSKCITAEGDGSYSDLTDCFVVSDSRRKRELSARALLRLSYKMSKPNGRQRYLIRSGYYGGYCLTRGGASGWTDSALGIDDCNADDERQQWHFESVGEYFENKFYVRNGQLCLRSKGNALGSLVDHAGDCAATDDYIFRFTSYGSKNTLFSLQNVASGLCMQIKWYENKGVGFVDYIEEQQCGLVGWSAWRANPINDPADDSKCGPNYGGKFCTGKSTGLCCKYDGTCGTGVNYCEKTICNSHYGPCFKSLRDWPNLDQRCGPWVATFADRTGKCQGSYAAPGFCCSKHGICGNTPQECLAENCDAEYGTCPQYAENMYPNKCGPYWGNKRCSGSFDQQCCSNYLIYNGTCGTSSNHCSGNKCDTPYGNCPDPDRCMWLNNGKKICRAGDCCHGPTGTCGSSEKFCGQECDAQLACGTCRGGLTTTAVGLLPEKYGVCITSSCSLEGDPCTVRKWCCSGLTCVDDPANSKKKKCVRA